MRGFTRRAEFERFLLDSTERAHQLLQGHLDSGQVIEHAIGQAHKSCDEQMATRAGQPMAARRTNLAAQTLSRIATTTVIEKRRQETPAGARPTQRPPSAAQLVAAFLPQITVYCRVHLGAVDDSYITADNIAQEVCTEVLDTLAEFPNPAELPNLGMSFSVFVFVIASRKVADACKVAERRGRLSIADNAGRHASARSGLGPTAATGDLSWWWYCVGKLPWKQRNIIVLRFAADLSFDEVATVLGVSVNVVRSRQARAMSRLRTIVRGFFDGTAS